MKTLEALRIKIFADGADKAGMLEMHAKPFIKGFTTNPTLMRRAGVTDYKAFALEILSEINDKPVSFEVLSDDLPEMERQAMEIASWGTNVYVKVPVTTARAEPCSTLVRRLARREVKVNVTALATLAQVREVVDALDAAVPSYVSVLAGRIADTGVDPVPFMTAALDTVKSNPRAELIWASPRELFNIFQADAIGCHVITVTHEILRRLPFVGRDLRECSLDTVKMFRNDTAAARFKL
jgi:transaldolase